MGEPGPSRFNMNIEQLIMMKKPVEEAGRKTTESRTEWTTEVHSRAAEPKTEQRPAQEAYGQSASPEARPVYLRNWGINE